MGDAQSAQREGKKDAAAEEESGKVDDAQTEQHIEEKPLKNNGQISEINGKADGSIAEVNGYCDDEIAAEAILSPDEDVTETKEPLKGAETPLENVNISEKESPNEADPNEEVTLEMTDMEAKQNDINEGFRKFFSNIGLKLTVKRGSGEKTEIATDVPVETNMEEPTADVEETDTKAKSENAEQNTDVNIAPETYDNDSMCATLTYVTCCDVLENAEEKTTEIKEEATSDTADTTTSSPDVEEEKTNQDTTPEEEQHPTSPPSPDQEVVVSPIKRFFTTGIFSGLRKKKKSVEDETTEKELVDLRKKEAVEATQDKEISPGVQAAAVETEHKENEFKEENLPAASAQMTNAPEVGENKLEGKLPPTDSSTVIVNEPELLSSQEKDKVQASPLKRLLSGSSLKKLPKKQRSRTSSDAKLSDSGEHVSDQVLSSTESAEHQREESPAQPSAEAAEEEDGAWASFKKLVTPKKRMKRSSLSSEDTKIPGSVEETKPSEGEQISDHSTEESKKRKDSSVSWEAVLCGSGRRRSRKTSDSEDETPQIENDNTKQGAESPLESSNEAEEILASSPKQAGSPSEGDGGSTWKSFKRLITPKRKGKSEEESKDNIQSDSEVTQDESSFSAERLLPGQKKRKSAEKQDQVSLDEADKDASGDEDSETPAVVPLSEFDTVETDVVIQTQADVESHVPKEADYELQQDLLDQMAEPVLPSDNLLIEGQKVQDNDDALQNQAPTTSPTNEDDALAELISKHQQLSDIPEEGIITETMGTPASVTEEAAGDDTIAEDLIEITSEVFTAPEPVDITQADETEMISAVSQLSESSKTSGNTTPVPAEYDVKEQEVLLQQVVETITTTSKALPVCTDDFSSEKIVGSVSHQILETFVTEDPKILEIHKKSDASAIITGLNVEELDAVDIIAATAQTEIISEVNEAVSTETVSEIPTEEFDTADIAVDEVHEVNVSQPDESIPELENTNESQHLQECLTEVNEAVSVELMHESKGISTDEGSIVGAHQTEIEPPKMDSQEADSAAAEAEEIMDGAVELEEQLETKDENIKSITNEVEVEEDSAVVVEELHALTAIKADTLDLEEGSDQTLEKEVISEDITAVETVTDELKEETVPLTEVNVEPENEDELPVDLSKAEHEEPEVLEAVDASKSDSDDGSVQSLKKEEKSKDMPAEEAVTEELEEATEANVESEELPVEAAKTEHIQEPELLPCDVKDIVTETETEAEAPTSEQEVTESVEEGSAQEPEKQKLLEEEIPETEDVIASEEIPSQVVAQLDQSLEINQDQKTQDTTDDIPQDVQVEEEDHTPEVVDELKTLTAVHVSSVNEEASSVQVLEKTVNSEEPPAPCVDIPAVTEEPKHEVHISEVQDNIGGEKEGELPGAEVKTAAVEHAEIAQVSTCNLKDISAAIPDVTIEKRSGINEPLIDTVVNELLLKETIETTTPLMKDDVMETAQEGSVVVMMHVPLVEFEGNQRIQVQVVDVNIKSAEAIVDTMLEVGVMEAKDVIETIDVCHETVKKVDNLSAISEIEEELISEENKVTIQEVIQHVKENLPESVMVQSSVQNEVVNVEQEVIKQQNAAIVESVLSEVDDQKVMEEKSTGASSERKDEGDNSAITTAQQASEAIKQTPDIPESSDVSIEACKEDLEETKAELQKSEVGVTAEDATCSSEELAMKKVNEDTMDGPQIAQTQIATPSNTGLVVPQNTGIISSIGNVEPPSSLSLEFKLNIQFGQTKVPVSPQHTTERTELIKQTDVSEVGVQAVEEVEPIRQINPVESHKQTELTEVAAQATEITEKAASLDSAETAVITNHPVPLDFGIQAMETVEPVEETKSTESVIPNVQATETIQPVSKTEKREMFLSQPILSEACDQEAKAEEPVKQTEEEYDQDVWLDAEEDIDAREQTEVSLPEEPLEHETDGDQEEKAVLEHEFEMPPNSKTEAEENQQEIHKTEGKCGTCEVDSEGEDFAVALEDPETATTSVTTMEWD
ncbi:titin [Thunnus maccoyii]|uniref:titin n=1 Tax=Thunnus maccoyii TaxID=8240 RepID=UPI001C4AAFC6|nr:titin [Thunnus maccoyii]